MVTGIWDLFLWRPSANCHLREKYQWQPSRLSKAMIPGGPSWQLAHQADATLASLGLKRETQPLQWIWWEWVARPYITALLRSWQWSLEHFNFSLCIQGMSVSHRQNSLYKATILGVCGSTKGMICALPWHRWGWVEKPGTSPPSFTPEGTVGTERGGCSESLCTGAGGSWRSQDWIAAEGGWEKSSLQPKFLAAAEAEWNAVGIATVLVSGLRRSQDRHSIWAKFFLRGWLAVFCP